MHILQSQGEGRRNMEVVRSDLVAEWKLREKGQSSAWEQIQ